MRWDSYTLYAHWERRLTSDYEHVSDVVVFPWACGMCGVICFILSCAYVIAAWQVLDAGHNLFFAAICLYWEMMILGIEGCVRLGHQWRGRIGDVGDWIRTSWTVGENYSVEEKDKLVSYSKLATRYILFRWDEITTHVQVG